MSSEETVDVAAPAEAAPVVFNVPALAVVGIEQRQHGLRHADYTRYRQYVTRKLHRMRKALKVPQGKHKFSKRPITVATVTDERHLMIPLFLADRAWAYFHEDKDLTARQPAKAYHGVRQPNSVSALLPFFVGRFCVGCQCYDLLDPYPCIYALTMA
eukprot:m.94621 g.94621  ORF g.94621 m.94621 type:complete len:157 (-) comp13023_c0_seq4:24889-25359(-)